LIRGRCHDTLETPLAYVTVKTVRGRTSALDNAQRARSATRFVERNGVPLHLRLTMRLSDAGLRQRQTKLIYLNHRSLLGSPKTRPRDRSNRLLGHGTTKKIVTMAIHNYHRTPEAKTRPAAAIVAQDIGQISCDLRRLMNSVRQRPHVSTTHSALAQRSTPPSSSAPSNPTRGKELWVVV
jgi:hypothetical protein